MKKLAVAIIIFLIAAMAFDMFTDLPGMHVEWDGEHVGGPMGAVIGLVAGGLGMLIAIVVVAFVGIVLALVFAGLGLMALVGLAIGAVVLAAVISPLLLPILVPAAIIWFLVSRSRKQKAAAAQAAPVAPQAA
jgi:hypothetical protein